MRKALTGVTPVLAAAITLFTTAGTALAATAPTTVSANPSPYATPGCLALDDQPGSLNYLNSEVEPWVSVDPRNGSHLVGAWQQDRWNNGGAHGQVAAYSTDGDSYRPPREAGTSNGDQRAGQPGH